MMTVTELPPLAEWPRLRAAIDPTAPAVIDGELTVKRLRFDHGRVRLVPENPAYADIVLEELSELTVWGVVTRCLHRV